MKFEYLLEDLLNEATPQEIYQKFYSDIPEQTFRRIISGDPQTIIQDNEIKRIGKFAKLLLKLFKENKLKLEDLPKAKEYLGHVYKRNVSLDINKINGIDDIYDIIKKYILQNSPELTNIINQLPKEEYQLKHDGGKWLIFVPLTEKASCYLGVNTQWCTTWGLQSLNKDYRDRTSHFSKHNNQGPLYIIINKENPSDKYQFHFETKQYMNPADKRINIQGFFDENEEITKFFFPSIYADQIPTEFEMVNMKVLSEEKSNLLMNRITSKTDNELVIAIVGKNLDNVKEMIKGDGLTDIEYNDNIIEFSFKRLPYELSDYSDSFRFFEGSLRNSYDEVYGDLESSYEDNWEEELLRVFESFYNENKVKIKQELNILNFETFKTQTYENFYENEKIQRVYLYKSAELTEQEYSSNADNILNGIKKYVSFESSYYNGELVSVPIIQLIKYLIHKNITTISDIGEVLGEYLSYNDVETSYDGIYDYERKYPSYEEIKYDVDDFFDRTYFDNDDLGPKCLELRNKFNDVLNRVFKSQYVFDNEQVYVKILSPKIDCDKGTVAIEYKNKNNGESYNGDVKIENLASYVTNYKLFENYIKFKKIIL
jgi:hypothetical protein